MGIAYPRSVVYAVDPKECGHTQRVLNDVWRPNVWNQRPGRGRGSLGGVLQPGTLRAWDDYTVHKTAARKEAMTQSTTTLFLFRGRLTPKAQPCDGLINKLLVQHDRALRRAHGFPQQQA